MKNLPLFLALLVAATGCNFSKSAKIDLISGITTTGDQLSCDDVFISVNGQKVERNTFVYGEKLFLNFNDIKGFRTEEGKVYPGMSVIVLATSGDTVFSSSDLYPSGGEGLTLSPLLLNASLIAADPIHSGKDYTMHVNIWDKKDKGTFKAALKFSVKANPDIKVEASQVTYDEIYLFSKGEGKVITDRKIKADDENYLIFEGLKGFTENGGIVFPGLSMVITDNKGVEVLKFDDLFSDSSESGIAVTDFNARISSSFLIPKAELSNPLLLKIKIWDKKGTAKLNASTDMEFSN